ncbi:ShlB/FhaC/HecB family hemolysin secretion/activation protein [Anaerospora hongkongensis]|uniref:ShlB/FhaC/HecB family hemolysin secretion/activation protein n=1 Tax=Anaerospora hongkongensis TaxID=244830 RepID=UPI00289F5FE1|nr:ShlB/FhaC/HecB family hemolysin secretion/activation protein [Anaerospora hongkongensis]
MNTTPGSYRSTRTLILLCTILYAAFSGASVNAAPDPNRIDDQEAQNRRIRQEAQERQQREQQPDVFLQKKQSMNLPELPQEELSFPVHTVKLEGQMAERFSWAQEIAKGYEGQNIGREGINVIVKYLSGMFVDKGYITTRIVIPEQDLSSGTLRLSVIPGMIQDIQFANGSSNGSWKSAFPTRPGRILNLRDLEQGLEQMKRLASQDADMQLVPGDQPGNSIVVITLKQAKPWSIQLSLDDSGSKSTGRLQAATTLAIDNLLGSNDLFYISFNKDAERADSRLGTRGDSFFYSIPQGYWTYSLSGYTYRYHQTVNTGGETFRYSGDSDNLELKTEKLFYRDQTRKSTISASLIKSESQSFIEDTEILGQRRDTTAAKLALSHRQYVGKTTIDAQLAYKRGVPWLGAQADPADLTPGSATTRYNLWLFDASITTPVALGHRQAQYNGSLRLQYSPDLLLGSEMFSIGSRYTVRGFDGEKTLMAEKGWYLRNELTLPLANTGQAIYLGVDCGRISGPSAADGTGQFLAGAALGMRGGSKGLQYDVFISKPLKKPAGFDTASYSVGFQLSYTL